MKILEFIQHASIKSIHHLQSAVHWITSSIIARISSLAKTIFNLFSMSANTSMKKHTVSVQKPPNESAIPQCLFSTAVATVESTQSFSLFVPTTPIEVPKRETLKPVVQDLPSAKNLQDELGAIRPEAMGELHSSSAIAFEENLRTSFIAPAFEEDLHHSFLFLSQPNLSLNEQDLVALDEQYLKSSKELKSSSLMSSGLNESLYQIKTEMDHINDDLQNLLKHRLINANRGSQLAQIMEENYGSLVVIDDPCREEQIKRIVILLSEIANHLDQDPSADEGKLKDLITDLVIVALYPPRMENGMPYGVISSDKLMSILNQLKQNPACLDSKLPKEYFEEEKKPSIYQTLLLLSHFNFCNLDSSLVKAALFQNIYNSPALPLFLANARVHVPQTYRQTCIGTAHNLYFQQHCSTIAEMLFVSRLTIQKIKQQIDAMSQNERQAPAFAVNYGSAPVKEEYANKILALAEETQANIEKETILLSSQAEPDPKKIANLTRQWNFLMQDLAMIIDPVDPRVYGHQYFPDHYYISAVLNATFTGLGKIAPGQPANQAIWKALKQNKLQELGGEALGNNDKKLAKQYVYRNSFSGSKAPLLNETTIEAVWQQVHEHNGAILDISYVGNGSANGHTIFIAAGFDGQERFFEIYDPMDCQTVRKSAKDFSTFLQDNYDKQSGRTLVTNQMYVYSCA